MRRPEQGSGTVLVIGVIGAVAAVLLGALALISAAEASTRARTAADLGALAGADRLVNGGAESPCATAQHIVRDNGGALASCTVDGDAIDLEATVSTRWPGLGPASARSRAGPASGGDPVTDVPSNPDPAD